MIELFYYWTTINFEIPAALVFQLEVYYMVNRVLIGLTAQQIGTTAQWYSNKTSPFFGGFRVLKPPIQNHFLAWLRIDLLLS